MKKQEEDWNTDTSSNIRNSRTTGSNLEQMNSIDFSKEAKQNWMVVNE